MTVSVKYNEKLGAKVALTELIVIGGAGERKALLCGWNKTERGARQQLLEQAKALRDELNLAIEDMIEELCAKSA